MNVHRRFVFDLYGTVLDISALVARASEVAIDGPAFVAFWREKQLAYAFQCSLMKRFEHFDSITARALDYTAKHFAVALDAATRSHLLAGWKTLAPHAEVESTFTRLHERGASIMILTNGVRESVRTALEHSGISHLIDRVWTVEPVRAYKPDPAVYNQVSQALGVEPHEISFVSSNGWDATGASEFGFVTIWCNRRGLPAETLGMPPALTIASLVELLDLP